MPDEFPTLEVVAALGVLVMLIRAWQLFRSARAVPRLHASLLEKLQASDRKGAVELCKSAEAPGYPTLALGVLAAAEESDCSAPAEETHAHLLEVADALRTTQRARLQSGLARDLVAMAILLGAVAYLRFSKLEVSSWFYGLCAAGAFFIASGFVLRRKLLRRIERVVGELVTAAVAMAQSTAATSAAHDPCPSCAGTEYIVLDHPAAVELNGSGTSLELRDLRICRRCGHVEAKVRDVDQLPVGHRFGTSLAFSGAHAAELESVEAEEHQG